MYKYICSLTALLPSWNIDYFIFILFVEHYLSEYCIEEELDENEEVSVSQCLTNKEADDCIHAQESVQKDDDACPDDASRGNSLTQLRCTASLPIPILLLSFQAGYR